LTALCSLAVRAGPVDARQLAGGFALLPRPDLLICLDASDRELEARLASRLSSQNRVERWFEQGSSQTRQQVAMVRRIAAMLKTKAAPALFFDCTDTAALEPIVRTIVGEMIMLREAA
jgi:ABC-type thiamine transport system ATPase subunit